MPESAFPMKVEAVVGGASERTAANRALAVTAAFAEDQALFQPGSFGHYVQGGALEVSAHVTAAKVKELTKTMPKGIAGRHVVRDEQATRVHLFAPSQGNPSRYDVVTFTVSEACCSKIFWAQCAPSWWSWFGPAWYRAMTNWSLDDAASTKLREELANKGLAILKGVEG